MSAAPSRLASAWSFLTGVPGRPLAAWPVRCWRGLPLLLPALALLGLAGWKWGFADPRVRAESAANQPLVSLEREVAALRLHRAPGETLEAARAQALRASLPSGSAGLAPLLARWQVRAAAQGWQAAIGPPVGQEAAPGAPLVFMAIRVGLQPISGNLHPWSSLVGLLGTFSDPESRIGVTRLAIRADEQGRYAVETRLSTPYLAEIQESFK